MYEMLYDIYKTLFEDKKFEKWLSENWSYLYNELKAGIDEETFNKELIKVVYDIAVKEGFI